MSRTRCALLCAGLAIVAAAAFAATIKVDHDPAIEFAKYRTFALRAGTAAETPWAQDMIESAIKAELAGKGLTLAGEKPDLIVVTHVRRSTEKQLNIDTAPGWRRLGTTGTISEYPVGTLVVDLVDAGSGKLVWRASAADTLPSQPKPDRAQKKLAKAVAKMFKDYPVLR
ncbi:MAG: DUF4136 domain-containing protein [Acidobacteria bacterium]|nr:DUF4136 domain-containing protein [Acidobacteriota bacterium]